MWKSELVPASYAPYVRSWLRLHPSWEYVFWSDGDIAWLFERHGLGALVLLACRADDDEPHEGHQAQRS